MESTLDIRVKQGRLFCAPALESQYASPRFENSAQTRFLWKPTYTLADR